MACTTDSGTETLFSDESPCELARSPSICSGYETTTQNDDTLSINSRLAPPNIQPFSGVLEKGKVVIRPIAFKPAAPGAMAPSSRFGDRYGSTPILTRPGSRLTLYGSTSDLRRQHAVQNYSLDRKLRSSCPSSASSPPLAMSSLPSLPHSHKLINYDSLESVRKSPINNVDCSLINKPAYRHSTSNVESLMDLTPSPSDSGVSELEAALRDRDSELAYLRQTMEHNEQVIFRVYQEKEKVWERELRRLKAVHENRLRASVQKALKLEQMLMMQSYQLNQDKKRLMGDVQKASFQNDKFKQEMASLRTRLEETEWGLCQKTGELSLLKTQLKECQNEQTAKSQELLQLRTEFRDLQQQFNELETDLGKQVALTVQKDLEIAELRSQLEETKRQLLNHRSTESLDKKVDDITETERLRAEIKELREELSDMSLNDYSNVQPGRRRGQNLENEEDTLEDLEIQKFNKEFIESDLEQLRRELDQRTKEFERERLVWAQEKEKVLRYQRQLQMNYVQIYRRSKALEVDLKNLTLSLKLDQPTQRLAKAEMDQTVEL
ncbi:leucine zipper putative tumor suppressor 2 homolog [Cylas formicarius]|uniref:leucine zipper putative tumor suppressor 2 homolog n=1 Tax=Cylas formicarius TaxID=197179 RepID=UPI002958B316|nr:leucine zipper putative tumor suppressor 2 homolog [Cylas formicarius]